MITKLWVTVETTDRAFRAEEIRDATETAIRRELGWRVRRGVRDVRAFIIEDQKPEDRQLTLVP